MDTTTSCKVPGCINEPKTRGWCYGHYYRWRKFGDPEHGGPLKVYRPHGLDLKGVFMHFMGGSPPPVEGTKADCWDWNGSVSDTGYGIMTIKGKNYAAHRASFEVFRRPLVAGEQVLHSCDRPICVNPAHLRAGTQRENVSDMISRDRHAPGSKHPNSKLSESDVLEIRGSTETLAVLAERFGVSFQTVSKIRNRERWKHV